MKFSRDAWFVHTEAIFESDNIKDDMKRYNCVITALKPKMLQELADITQKPPEQDKYGTLKKRILERFGQTQEQRLHALFKGIDTKGKKPSQLLREMHRLVGTTVQDDALKVKWLDLMLEASRRILVVLGNDVTLDKLAGAADQMAAPANVAPLKPSSRSSSPYRTDPALYKELAAIGATMAQLLSATTLVLEAVTAHNNGGRRGRSNGRGPGNRSA